MGKPNHLPRDEPRGRTFYEIIPNDDGTVDVYLAPDVTTYDAGGIKEYDIQVRVVRGIVPYDHIEDDIRARYLAWCDSAEVINL